MPSQEVRNFSVSLDSFDASLLGEQRIERTSPEFTEAVHRYLTNQFEGFGGWANIAVNTSQIRISWRPDPKRPDVAEFVLKKLEAGNYSEAILLMGLLLQDDPNNEHTLYNLGMALSEVGRLPEATDYLRRLLEIDANNTNARVALGVALQRQKCTEDAIGELQQALRQDPKNPWAHRNLGACLLTPGKFEEARDHLEAATVLSPTDQQAWLGLGKAYRALGENEQADDAFKQVIDLGEYSDIAEIARLERSAIGQETFREKGSSIGRPDAVMYCLSALQKFKSMPADKVRAALLEIALKGRQGFDVNDPAQQYSFKSMPGNYSGLAAVCYMYVAGKLIMPEHDFGFDLADEYKAAQSLLPKA